jgi:hypothetical protein
MLKKKKANIVSAVRGYIKEMKWKPATTEWIKSNEWIETITCDGERWKI